MRFEFWLMIPLIWVIFFTSGYKNKLQFFIHSFLLLAFPFYWGLCNYFHSGNFFGFFSNKYRNAQQSIPEVPYYNFFLATEGWIDKLLEQTGIMGLILIIYAYMKMLNINGQHHLKKLVFIFIPIYFLLLLIIQVFLGTMEWLAPRYLFVVSFSLIPIFSYGLVHIYEIACLQKKNVTFWIIITIFAIFSFLDVFVLIDNVKNWRQSASTHDLAQVSQLVNYYEAGKFFSKPIIYVSPGDWLIPMFIYLTQRHDIVFITPQDFLSQDINYPSLIILKNSPKLNLHCKKNETFQNDAFTVCDYH